MLTRKRVIKYHKDFVLSNPDIYIKERPYPIYNIKKYTKSRNELGRTNSLRDF